MSCISLGWRERKSAQTARDTTSGAFLSGIAVAASMKCEHTGDFRRYKSRYATPLLYTRRILSAIREFVEWKLPAVHRV